MDSVVSIVLSYYRGLKTKIRKNKVRAKRSTLDKIYKDTEPYIPYKTGALDRTGRISYSNSTITWGDVTAPYASFAFDPVAPSGKPKVYNRSKHLKAQGNPFQASKEANEVAWAEFYAKELLKDVE